MDWTKIIRVTEPEQQFLKHFQLKIFQSFAAPCKIFAPPRSCRCCETPKDVSDRGSPISHRKGRVSWRQFRRPAGCSIHEIVSNKTWITAQSDRQNTRMQFVVWGWSILDGGIPYPEWVECYSSLSDSEDKLNLGYAWYAWILKGHLLECPACRYFKHRTVKLI